MRIRWTPAAAADLESISDYLKEHHPHYRQRTMRRLYETIRSLRQAPYRGRPGTEEGTREILFPPLPYVAIYQVNERQQTVEVLRVLPWRTRPALIQLSRSAVNRSQRAKLERRGSGDHFINSA